MLDKHTFGKTPAAIYLADRLNVLDDSKYTRKVSSRIHDVQRVIAEMVAANEAGILSIHTLGFMSTAMREKIEILARNLYALKHDDLSMNLFQNVLKGELKSIVRRSREVKLLKTKQQRLMTKVGNDRLLTVTPITIGDIKDPTTPESLIEKSRAKLKRKGKQSNLYQ